MPSAPTVCAWVRQHPDFAERYARARETQADLLFEEIQQIADTPLLGEKTKLDASGNVVETTTGDMIEHRRLQIEARKWILGRMMPQKYGDRIEHKHSGSVTLESLVANDPD